MKLCILSLVWFLHLPDRINYLPIVQLLWLNPDCYIPICWGFARGDKPVFFYNVSFSKVLWPPKNLYFKTPLLFLHCKIFFPRPSTHPVISCITIYGLILPWMTLKSPRLTCVKKFLVWVWSAPKREFLGERRNCKNGPSTAFFKNVDVVIGTEMLGNFYRFKETKDI